tara:strand:- start:10718 stop:11146 length:429 start_codon:yes stop_codon:yes gene_type:complete
MWKTILKAPVFTQDEIEDYTGKDPDDRFDKYLSDLNRFGKKLPLAFQSTDGNARAKFRLNEFDGKPYWDLNIFEIINEERGKGKGRIYLKEFVSDIRDLEKQLHSVTGNKNELEIWATQSWGSEGFWEKMIQEDIIQGQSVI